MRCNLLTDPGHAELAIPGWRAMLRHGWEAGELDAQLEHNSGRTLTPQERGPKRQKA